MGSALHCVPTALTAPPAAGTGAILRSPVLRRYALAAGFTAVEVLTIENDFWRFYTLHGCQAAARPVNSASEEAAPPRLPPAPGPLDADVPDRLSGPRGGRVALPSACPESGFTLPSETNWGDGGERGSGPGEEPGHVDVAKDQGWYPASRGSRWFRSSGLQPVWRARRR